MMKRLIRYLNKNMLVSNAEKSKVLVFGKGGRRGKRGEWKWKERRCKT